ANGVAVVALKNAHHIGRVGTYGELCAAAGLVSLHFVNITDQRPAVAPWRGSDGRFGTNPLCIALPGPAPDRPIIADMATSRIAMGKVRVARNKGEQVAPGTLLDADGKPTTDPHVMYRQPRGALMTFGEHKGYALAFICEMLAGAVTGSGTMRPERQDAESVTNGMLTIAIDPRRLVDQAWMLDEIAAMAGYITGSPPGRANEPVLIPGRPRARQPRPAPREGRTDRRRDLARDHACGARSQCVDRGPRINRRKIGSTLYRVGRGVSDESSGNLRSRLFPGRDDRPDAGPSRRRRRGRRQWRRQCRLSARRGL